MSIQSIIKFIQTPNTFIQKLKSTLTLRTMNTFSRWLLLWLDQYKSAFECNERYEHDENQSKKSNTWLCQSNGVSLGQYFVWECCKCEAIHHQHRLTQSNHHKQSYQAPDTMRTAKRKIWRVTQSFTTWYGTCKWAEKTSTLTSRVLSNGFFGVSDWEMGILFFLKIDSNWKSTRRVLARTATSLNLSAHWGSILEWYWTCNWSSTQC